MSPSVTVLLCGDVMTGRGIDQILAQPVHPRLWEPFVQDARDYVALAEAASGPIPRPVDGAWPWGDALRVIEEIEPDVRVLNLETSVTRRGEPASDKRIHYRMAPENLACLTVARPMVCTLANNHVLDFGHSGLMDTLDTLAEAGIPVAGAGLSAREAEEPVTIAVGPGRVIVFSFGDQSSGIPQHWAATGERPGVALLPDLDARTADRITRRAREIKRAGDVVVVSIHWGSNWGYEVPDTQIAFAHRLVDGGVDIVHGHSSHHPRRIEVYRRRLILYGCGDLINDYEGIGGYGQFGDDLRLLYFASVDPATGILEGLRLIPMRAQCMRLQRASDRDTKTLRDLLMEQCGSSVEGLLHVGQSDRGA